MELSIRRAGPKDADAIWAMLEPVIAAGDTYTFPPDITRGETLEYWLGPKHRTFVAEVDGQVAGTYYLRANQPGGGDHVCNCGFVTAHWAAGRGVARAMLDHSQKVAKEAGFRAMQFNFVVATNTRAIATWERAGFQTVGRLPGAFRHPDKGYVDALVMFKHLA
ncbi:MAG: N-acetyltransferase [Pseudomonadota bacterium]